MRLFGSSLPSDDEVLVIGGAQKCATTSLAALLRTHPGVVGDDEECLAFEGQAASRRTQALARAARGAQQSSRVLLVKRPEIFHSPIVSHRVSSVFPRATMVVVLGAPGPRTASALRHYQGLGVLSPTTTLTDCLRSWESVRDRTIAGQVVGFSFYAAALERLHEEFCDPVVLMLDELMADTAGAIEPILARCGREPLAADHLSFRNRAQEKAAAPPLVVRGAGFLTYRWNPLDRLLERRSLPFRAAAWASLRVTLRPPMPVDVPPVQPMPPEFGTAFDADLDQVESILGRPVPSGWRSRESAAADPRDLPVI